MPPALVETVPVVRDRVYEEVRLTGTILPRRYTMVMGEVSGIVEQMHVDDGDFVQAGQPLVTLRSAPARFELEAARADLAQLVAELEELENGERPEDIRAREAELRDAKARLVLAEEEEQRVRELLDSGTTSQSTYDTRRAELERAQAAVELAGAALDRARNGARPEIIASKRAEMEAARARVDQLQDRLERHVLRAPFSGVVGQKATEVGQWMAAGTAAFALAEVEVLRAEVNLPEKYFNRVSLGMKGQVTIDALRGVRKEAEVTVKVPLGSQTSRTFPVRLDIPNDDFQIAPGMLARVSFLVSNGGGEAAALLVPKDALLVQGTGDSRKLWVVEQGERGATAQQRTVRLVGEFRDMVVIADGEVAEGDEVIVRGNESIMFPGQPVSASPHGSKGLEAMKETEGQGVANQDDGDEAAQAAGNGGRS